MGNIRRLKRLCRLRGGPDPALRGRTGPPGSLPGFRGSLELGETKAFAPPPPLTFAAFRSKPEVVDLAALTVLAGDARLALALATADVALPIGGTQSVAVTPERNT